jgi:hypothetical protein
VNFHDDLTSHHVPQLGELAAWRAARDAAWTAWGRRFGGQGRSTSAARDAHELLHAESVVCWLGDTIQEQLMLAWLCALLDPSTPIQLARPRVPGRLVSVSSTSSADLAAAPWVPLADHDRQAGRALWCAFTASEPTALFAWIAAEARGPFDALPALLDRFPDPVSGLDANEAAVLHALAARPERPLPYVLVEGFTRDERDRVGDAVLFGQLLELSRRRDAHRLLDHQGGRSIRGARLTLTPAGHEVLAGRASRIELIGLDRWIGGTHLTGATPHPRPYDARSDQML